jgi:hypothetical protein
MEFLLFLVAGLTGYFIHFIFHRNQLNKFKDRIDELDLQIRDNQLEIFELQEKLILPISFSFEREKMN